MEMIVVKLLLPYFCRGISTSVSAILEGPETTGLEGSLTRMPALNLHHTAYRHFSVVRGVTSDNRRCDGYCRS